MCSREIFTLADQGNGAWQRDLPGIHQGNLIPTIGEDARGVLSVGTDVTSDSPGLLLLAYQIFLRICSLKRRLSGRNFI